MDMKSFRVLGGRLTFQRVGHEWVATWLGKDQAPATAVALGSIALPLVSEGAPDPRGLSKEFIQLMRSAAMDYVEMVSGIRPEFGEMVPIEDRSELAEAVPMGRA